MVGPKKQEFWPKNQHTPRKLLYFVNTKNDTCQKLGMILENKVVQKLKLEKNGVFFTKNGLLN